MLKRCTLVTLLVALFATPAFADRDENLYSKEERKDDQSAKHVRPVDYPDSRTA